MIVAIDADSVETDGQTAAMGERSDDAQAATAGKRSTDSQDPSLTPGARHPFPTAPLCHYIRFLIDTLTAPQSPLAKVVVLSNPDNHRLFLPLQSERCDVAMVPRPLFQVRPVRDWQALLWRHPRAGADLLAEHQDQKLRIMGQTGASVIHFPADAFELMEMDAPVVVSLHSHPENAAVPLSALLADAIILDSPDLAGTLAHDHLISPQRTFVVPWPPASSTPTLPKADKHQGLDGARADALCEAYEHALASFELRKAA